MAIWTIQLVESPLDTLTIRERYILLLLASSFTVKEIALKCKLSPKTIEYHRANLQRKLRIYDVAGLTRFAIANKMLKATDDLATQPHGNHALNQ